MPNHIKSKVTFRTTPEVVGEIIKRYSTEYAAKLKRAHDGSIICKEKGEEWSFGWFNERTGMFHTRNGESVVGIPTGWEMEIEDNWTHFPDFKKITPRPEIFDRIISESITINGVYIENPIREKIKKIDFNELTMKKDNDIEYSECDEDEMWINRAQTNAERLEVRELGFSSWYEWSNANWGTKWNSYSCEKLAWNCYKFETAWGGVPTMICKLSESFPEVVIEYKYADEDSGSNVGDMVIRGGEIISDNSPENQSNEAYEIYLELNPDCDYIKMIDGKYQYVEEDEEEDE